jgi:tetratricopeptide (TPR) repeat protein
VSDRHEPADTPAFAEACSGLTAASSSTPAAAEGSGLDLRRYELLEELGHGGMGEVYRSRDPALGRDLALKVLAEKYRGNGEMERRFEAEACITASLQHPAIVPVYNLGRLPDGRLYFTMKVVRGQTFAEMLRDVGQVSNLPGTEASWKLAPRELPRWLTIFEHVCQAVAYAHSKDVIHRDLKPGNVMVGRFGEVQVMDWGLAKVVRPAGSGRDESTQATEASGLRPLAGALQTVGAMGTPEYMPPEQANGEWDRADERLDVFALGGILCAILTGRPPYQGDSTPEVWRKAQRGDLAEAFARLDDCGADPVLVALAQKCLSPEVGGRPWDAGVVAKCVTAYLASAQERLRAAELERAAAQARAVEERKRRRLAVRLGAAVLALLAALAAGGLYLQQQRARAEAERAVRAERARNAAESALGQVEGLLARARWVEAEALLLQAEDRLDEAVGVEDVGRRLDRAKADLGLARALDGVRLDKAAVVGGKWDPLRAAPAYAAVFQTHGLDLLRGEPGAVAGRIQGLGVRGQVVAALDDWALAEPDEARRGRLLAVARVVDPNPWRDRFRDPKLWADPARLRRLARRANAGELSPALLVVLGVLVERAGGDGVRLLAEGQRLHPDDFWLGFTLAIALEEKGRLGEAIGYYRTALAVRPEAAVVHLNLGNALKDNNDLEGALASTRRAVALAPRFAPAHFNLGNVQYVGKDLEGAIASYGRALALDSRLTGAHINLGNALKDRGDLRGAVACYRRALAVDPRDALAHANLGNALFAGNDFAGAAASYREVVTLTPLDARAFANLGNALYELKDLDGAVANYRKAVALDAKFAVAHHNLGTALKASGDLQGAIRCYRRALALDPGYAQAHYNLGIALVAAKDLAGAVASYRQALALAPQDGQAHAGLGQALLLQGRFAAARDAARLWLGLFPAGHPSHKPASQQLQRCEALLALDKRLDAVRQGAAEPRDAAERLALGWLAQQPYKRHYAAAARHYATAFAAQPGLAEDLGSGHRYNATCAAAMAAAGQDKDATKPDEQERARLRGQALAWLKADLAARAKLANGTPEQRTRLRNHLAHSLVDADLTSVRDKAALEKLPAAERDAWRKLWADVNELRKRVGDKK